MVDLVFFSTNRTKVAHFRYLAEQIGVSLKSFHEAYYSASYDEPRIDDREELLRRSYLSAMEKWKRRSPKIESDLSTFFLEDTSVRIDALSAETETPGVHVKYWMRDMTFERLDAMLKEKGNNRRASVRSDIVMHLPSRWRELLGVSEAFLWVYGEVQGTVVEQDLPIQQNLVYPWLDDKTFNRWFVPDGVAVPVSALEIKYANKFDFRKRAFSQIESVLKSLRFLEKKLDAAQTQLELPRLASPPSILIICGPTCAGKTTSAAWMNKKYGVPHIEASDFMYKAFWERHGLHSSVRIGDFAEAALSTQPGIVASAISRHIEKKGFNRVAVTGFRAPEEIDIFRRNFSLSTKIDVLYLDAEADLRLKRAILRNRENVNAEKFKLRNEQEIRMGLGKIASLPNIRYFENNLTTAILFRKFRQKYEAFLKLRKEVGSDIKIDSGLEDYILLALLSAYSSGKWLTTTEVAALINKKFKINKWKDNVSRYFNQEYHPYYDVRLRAINGKMNNIVEYQLSTTGLSEAKLLSMRPMASSRRSTSFQNYREQYILPLEDQDLGKLSDTRPNTERDNNG